MPNPIHFFILMPLVHKIFTILALSKKKTKKQDEYPSLFYVYIYLFSFKMITSLKHSNGGGVSLHHFPLEVIQQYSTRPPFLIRARQHIYIYEDKYTHVNMR